MTGKQIKELRKKLGLTQEEFAKKIEVARVTVARWEAGLSNPEPLAVKVIELVFNLKDKKKK